MPEPVDLAADREGPGFSAIREDPSVYGHTWVSEGPPVTCLICHCTIVRASVWPYLIILLRTHLPDHTHHDIVRITGVIKPKKLDLTSEPLRLWGFG